MFRQQARRLAVRGAALVATGALVAACGAGAGDVDADTSIEDMDPVTLKVATIYGPDSWQTTPVREYAEAVEEKSGGKISFEFFYGEALLAPDEMAGGLRSGLADIAYVIPVYTAANFPIDDWASPVGFVSDGSPIAGALQSMAAQLDWSMNDADYQAEFAGQGIQLLAPRMQPLNRYHLLCNEPVTTLEEARGKRVRIGGQAWAQAAEDVGMIPVSLTGSEIYTGFQRGIIDCFMGALEDMKGLSLTDVATDFTNAGFVGFSSYNLAMSQQKWDSLPLAAQQLLWDEVPTYLAALMRNSFIENQAFIAEAEEQGIVLAEADDAFAQAIADWQESVLGSHAGNAPDGVSDPEASLQAFLDAHERWLSIIGDDLGYLSGAGSWAEQVAQGVSPEDVDTTAWAERVREEIYDPHRPQ